MSIRRITLEEEMKKNPQLKLSDIQSLKEWCEKQSHLPKIEDSFLALFLHSNYYQMESTKRTIENYYTTRTHSSEFFCNRDPLEEKELRQAFKVSSIFRLNGVTKNGYKMIYRTFLDADPSHYIFKNDVKYGLMLLDMSFLMDGTNNGYVLICDASKLSFGHVIRMNPLEVKKCFYYIQEAAPVRLKAMHIINTPFAMRLFMRIAKPFIKQELMDMKAFPNTSRWTRYQTRWVEKQVLYKN
ncbi:alpha-tocopherol transfer protein-like isoform X2 [Solenopsis invicta]|uniref:alpha-tocopherol transfer protein-like isoform X2 n=1 Tax=Solenopsis invicta TaxID=13686 RepID=UPI0005962627|nr:alpha-tocopherol transfer protein-like isoform X2 [Solenopsis invicta]